MQYYDAEAYKCSQLLKNGEFFYQPQENMQWHPNGFYFTQSKRVWFWTTTTTYRLACSGGFKLATGTSSANMSMYK